MCLLMATLRTANIMILLEKHIDIGKMQLADNVTIHNVSCCHLSCTICGLQTVTGPLSGLKPSGTCTSPAPHWKERTNTLWWLLWILILTAVQCAISSWRSVCVWMLYRSNVVGADHVNTQNQWKVSFKNLRDKVKVSSYTFNWFCPDDVSCCFLSISTSHFTLCSCRYNDDDDDYYCSHGLGVGMQIYRKLNIS